MNELELLKGQVQSVAQKLKEISEQLEKVSPTSRVITWYEPYFDKDNPRQILYRPHEIKKACEIKAGLIIEINGTEYLMTKKKGLKWWEKYDIKLIKLE